MKSFFKILAIVFALLCAVSAYLQLNDPDPLLWISIYSLAALVAILFVLNKLPNKVYLMLFALCILGSYLFWPKTFEGVTIGTGDINNIEHARESIGLLIVGVMMLVFWFKSKKNMAR